MKKQILALLLFLIMEITLVYILEELYGDYVPCTTNPLKEWGNKEVFTIRNKHLAALGVFTIWAILLSVYFHYLIPEVEKRESEKDEQD